jgi:predicted ribosomally synthesized peptide with nif11-like leader
MSISNVASLIKSCENNPELKARIKAASSSEEVAKIGAEVGFEFSTEDAESFRQNLIKRANGELSEDELEAAVGGAAHLITRGAQGIADGAVATGKWLGTAAVDIGEFIW